MQQLFIPLIFLSLLFSNDSFASKYVAKVIFLKGKATQLRPRAHKATPVKLHTKLEEDSSILTYDGSVLKISFFDGSKTTLGPKSKFIIKKSDPQKGSILGLLKGTIRNQVKKGANKRLFIKTRTAALGVRGTDFQTIYNPDIKITSLITFTGRVAMAKLNTRKKTSTHINQTPTSIHTDYNFDSVSTILSSTSLDDDFAEFDSMLETNEAVEIKPGRFSTTASKVKKPTIPVRISPAQFKVMKANTNLVSETKLKIENIEKETIIAHKTENIKIDANDPPPEGYTNLAKNEIAPRAGGFIDVNSGIYIPPEDDAKFNTQTKLFIPEKIGNISKKTGEYVAPEGLALDAKKGFIAKNEKANKETIKQKEKLNEHINKTAQIETKKKSTPSFWLNGPINPENKYKVGHHHIQFGFVPGSSISKYRNPYSGRQETHHTDVKNDVLIEYTWRISKRFALGLTNLDGNRKFKLSKMSCMDCGDDRYNSSWSRRFIYASLFANERAYMRIGFGEAESAIARHAYIDESSQDQTGQYYFEDLSNPLLVTTFNYVFFPKNKLKIMGELLFAYLAQKEENGKTGNGHEFACSMEGIYELNTWFGIFLNTKYSYRYLRVNFKYDQMNPVHSSYNIHNFGIGTGVFFSI